MAVDQTMIIKKLQSMKEVYVAASQATNMPFVICDPDSYNDQVWVFETEPEIQQFAKEYTAKSIPLLAMKVENDQFLAFYSNLYTLGVNTIVYNQQGAKTEIELKNFVIEPDYTALPKEKIPLSNPQLQLTALYFMQEFRRPVKAEEKKNLIELEEEMAANLVKSQLLVAVWPQEEENKDQKPNIQLPFVKNTEGEVFQPVFTDAREFHKFNKEQKFKAVSISFQDVSQIMLAEAKGVVVNPFGFNLIVLREQIETLLVRFDIKTEEN